MDSLTQIVLGAAMGEAVAGKKIGNRAIVWGAVGGTIPDLDVLANGFLSQINSLAFHRGFTHSILFAILGAFVFGWLVDWLYRSKFHRYIAGGAWSIFILLIGAGFLGIINFKSMNLLSSVGVGSLLAFLLYRTINRYVKNEYNLPNASLGDWQKVFFWSIFTHPLLDCHTVYGTQLFQPFSDYRVGWNNISVADPAYSTPFMICVIIVCFLPKWSKWRPFFNWLGIGISSAYMIFTIFNKFNVNDVFKDTLQAEKVSYSRYMSSPTILNNALWYACAEGDSTYTFGQYSIFDSERVFKLSSVLKNHHLLGEVKEDDRIIDVLRWFSNEYYSVIDKGDGTLQFNDLRYGTFTGEAGEERDYIFNFTIKKKPDGYFELLGDSAGPPEDVDMNDMAKRLWTRIKGI